MTDMEKVLKKDLCNFKKLQGVYKDFCCNTIHLSAETYIRVKKDSPSESWNNICKKIYKVEVVIDGKVVFEHYGKDADEMNKQYLLALDMCQG